MAIIKPFKGYKPKKEIVQQLASRPYDVISSEEARELVKDNPHSFLHVVKPEVDLPVNIDVHSTIVYEKGKENLEKLLKNGTFVQDQNPCYYIYAQTFMGKTQYGLVGCAAVEDYEQNVIKIHELTRPDKEDDRVAHINVTNFNAEPVFFTYPDNNNIDKIVEQIIQSDPDFDFDAGDGVSHHLWTISEVKVVEEIEKICKDEVPFTYVADGHHRTAAASRVGSERKANNPNHIGNEEYNYFLAVHFPASQLRIIDYNRVIKDLNGLTPEQFIEKLKNSFEIELKGPGQYKPQKLHEFSMHIENNWYKLTAKEGTYNDNHPIEILDVTILTKQILDPILDIKDLRTSTRIDFVGGIRGLGELEKRVNSGEMIAAFALFPVSMKQLIDIADSGNIMPPKTTWFEPKLRSGLVIHELK